VKRVRTVAVAAVACGLAVLAPPVPAAAATGSYAFRIRAAALQPQFSDLVMGAGHSEVGLDGTGRWARCEALAAGFDEGGLTGEHPQPLRAPRYNVHNPVRAVHRMPASGWDAPPEVQRLDSDERIAGLPADGPAPRWQARCADRRSGTATAHSVDAGAQAGGSTVTAGIDRATGEYVATARAFAAGVETGSGTVDLVSSVFGVRRLPGRPPTVTYRIGVSGGTLASGVDVPYERLAEQFNASVAENAAAVDHLGPLGLILVGPSVVHREYGRDAVSAPFLEVTVGVRETGLPRRTHTRLVTTDFEGLHPV
jgi:hypothetical protein